MATEIVMPRLGWTMEEGSVVEWLKKDGDTIAPGDIVFTVEGDKAINEIESFEGGILRIPPDSPSPGTLVPVGKLLAYLVQPGEAAPFDAAVSSAPVEAASPIPQTMASPKVAQPAPNGKANGKANGKQTLTISPRARRVAGELGVDWTALTGSGRTGRIVERDVRAAITQQAAAASVKASPLAKRIAEELNVNLESLAASMPGKRIEKADVERAAGVVMASVPAPAPIPAPTPVAQQPTQQPAPRPAATSGETRSRMSSFRRTTASRMSASVHTAAPVTLTTEADATELVKLRKRLKQDAEATGRPAPSYNDLLVRLAADALTEYPALNSRIDGDDIVTSEAVAIGLAVDTDRGLLVPVIHDAQTKNLRQISRESAALIERARAGSLTSADMTGGTFTITNLGMYEIDAFTPIINLPECAILGVGRIVAKQVVIDAEAETLAVRHMVFLSLTFDHRLVDGGPAARFLQRIKQSVEHPLLGLL